MRLVWGSREVPLQTIHSPKRFGFAHEHRRLFSKNDRESVLQQDFVLDVLYLRSRIIMHSSQLRAIYILVCFFSTINLVDAGETKQQRHAQLELIKSRIAGVQKKMRTARGEQQQQNKQLQVAEQEIGAATKRVRELTTEIEALARSLEQLRHRKQAQSNDLKAQREQLARQIYSAYAMGRQERLKILFNQQDPSLLSRVMTYYDYIHRARAARMSAIEQKLEAIRLTQLEISDHESALRRLQGSELASRALLEQQQERRRGVLATLANELRDADKELARLRGDAAQLSQLLVEIEQALADIPDANPGFERFERRKGSLPWPSKGKIVASFAGPKAGGMRWDGVMISAPEGREVHAVHHGRVAFADWLRGFGLLLILDHGDGWMTLYGHNQSLFKEVGDWVEAGESVALVGNSGGQQTSGVYFVIRHQGTPIDPGRWCRKPRGRRVG